MDFYEGLFRSRISEVQVPEQDRLVSVPEGWQRDIPLYLAGRIRDFL